MTVLLSVEDAAVSYGAVEAVRGVALQVASGSVATIIGANGAGKTSLLSALGGLLPMRGRVIYDGHDITRLGTADRVAAGLALVTESRDLFGTMTVEDNLRLGAYTRTRAEAAQGIEEVFGRFPKLKERRTQLAGTLSGGERQMLATGRALMSRPSVLMLDEPSLGLAPLIVRDIFHIITELRNDGIGVLLVEQNARAALQTADHAYVMELGRFVMQGAAAEMMHDQRLVETYLGISGAGN
ncbi:ATP-binding cassette domain-containing protein [Frigidibacter albus]|uniref:ATP-binding cassette domain-containing protein n=1 Tax=Frigidibacter albus TaxID=1465486 RepID=A0A6L8VP60_9RHOB|nr:ABC transporter ATP-binding protein [Frigidibacter albus]MZQ91129.1 ATP-binding cassette domain-containing protein [Frigidibacter albus]NBE33060.1 ATP-binding cassette domain-containing protein [Frigidibacter albus]GGH62941.1 ABC transporter ATP-binding protein [Frigidibacter albus]